MMESKEVRLTEMWPLMAEQLKAGKKVRFAPKGISMLPMIRQNLDTVVITSPPKRLRKYDLTLYRRENGQFVLHRVVGIDRDGSYIMCGDNQYAREYGITDKNILAVAEGYYRGDEYIACTDKKYLKYSKKQVRKQLMRRHLVRVKQLIKRMIRVFYAKNEKK